MKTLLFTRSGGVLQRAAATIASMWLVFAAHGLPIITQVVETNGDNAANPNLPAKFTGQTFNHPNEGNNFTVPPFGEDVPAFTDRTHEWNGPAAALGIPAYLLGGEYIMLQNNNRDNNNPPLQVDVTISEEALVYVLVDNRMGDSAGASPPDFTANMTWLLENGWTAVMNGLNRNGDNTVPDEIGVDEGGDGVGPGNALNQWSSVYVKLLPAGTFTLHQPDNAGQNMYGVVVARPPGSTRNPPQITSLSPTNNVIFHNASAGLTVTATTQSPNQIAASNIVLVLNTTNVSSGLVVTGSATNRTAAFSGLASNTIYNAQLIISDQAGRATTNTFTFDTFNESSVRVIEAEDYNYESGRFIESAAPGAYANLVGVAEIDYHDNATATAAEYRTSDTTTIAITGDVLRKKFSDAGVVDYHLGSLQAGDWVNYTRTFANQTYHLYLRASSSSAQQVRLEAVTGAAPNQTVTPLGNFFIPSGPFQYVPLADVAGTPTKTRLNGATTLRLTGLPTANPTAQLNFLMLVPAAVEMVPPYISSAFPPPGASNVPLNANPIAINIAHGTTRYTAGSIRLSVNGVNVPMTQRDTPTGVELTGNFPAPLLRNSTNQLNAIFSDTGGGQFTNSWSFTTVVFRSVITQVVETGGDDSDNTPAQYSGQTFAHPNLGTITLRTFGEDAPAFRDRTHQWNGAAINRPIPNYLAGAQYIMSRNDNRDNNPYQIDVTVSEPALVYVLVDNRLSDGNGGNPPDFSGGNMSWLIEGGWVPVSTGWNRAANSALPDEVGVDEGGDGTGPGQGLNQWSSIYVKQVPAGTFSLLQADNAGRNMYGAVVKAFADHDFIPVVTITSPTAEAGFASVPTNIVISASAVVTNSAITKVEFYHGGTNKIGEDTSAPYSVTWSNPTPGRYYLTAKAFAANALSGSSAVVPITVGKVISVNFQAATATTPAGYLPDIGEVFGDRGNGFTYGWDEDNQAHARDRNSGNSPDERYDTFNHLQKADPAGELWEIALPNGRYSVHVVAGEPSNVDSVYDLTAEGTTIVRGTPANPSPLWFEATAVVTVTDGRLTLSNGPTAQNNKIAFVEIAELPAEVARPVLQIARSGTNLTITWSGGGKLQEAAEVIGPWQDVAGNPAGSHSVQTTGSARKFYRVVLP